jgi:hypothetical protein
LADYGLRSNPAIVATAEGNKHGSRLYRGADLLGDLEVEPGLAAHDCPLSSFLLLDDPSRLVVGGGGTP